MKVVVEVPVIDIKEGDALFIPRQFVIGKVRQCKGFKRIHLHPSEEELRQIIKQARVESIFNELNGTCPHSFTSAHHTHKRDCRLCMALIKKASLKKKEELE